MILNLVDRWSANSKNENAESDGWSSDSVQWQIAAKLAGMIGLPDWYVNLVLVDDTTMSEMNSVHRKVEGVTDVLSFAYLVDKGSGEADLAAGKMWAYQDLWLDELDTFGNDTGLGINVGELIIAPSFVRQRCLTENWHPEHELFLLIVHGCLHVLGWEHDREDNKKAMQKAEQEILHRADLPHPLIGRS